jgi:hypothetical protein
MARCGMELPGAVEALADKGTPQCGQLGALSLMDAPHSVHAISAIFLTPQKARSSPRNRNKMQGAGHGRGLKLHCQSEPPASPLGGVGSLPTPRGPVLRSHANCL